MHSSNALWNATAAHNAGRMADVQAVRHRPPAVQPSHTFNLRTPTIPTSPHPPRFLPVHPPADLFKLWPKVAKVWMQQTENLKGTEEGHIPHKQRASPQHTPYTRSHLMEFSDVEVAAAVAVALVVVVQAVA
eukprot:361259-Chlamydomonas_euryale.AAC.1